MGMGERWYGEWDSMAVGMRGVWRNMGLGV